MKDLIAELEAAPEGSEVLDVAICKAICHYGPDDPLWHVLPYSRSLDAALTLVPEGWNFEGSFTDPDNDYVIEGWNGKFAPGGIDVQGSAHTAVLALCIAALRARQAMEQAG